MKKINLIKIWSDSIVDKKSKSLKLDFIQNILSDIIKIKEQTWESFIILSSWSVAKWISLVDDSNKYIKSTLSSLWQHRLVWVYDRLVWKDNLVSQILIDDKYNENFFNKTALENNLILGNELKTILRPC